MDELDRFGAPPDDLPSFARPRLARGGTVTPGAGRLVGEGPGCDGVPLAEILELDRRHGFGGRLAAAAQDRAGHAIAGGAARAGSAEDGSRSVDATPRPRGRS